MVDFMVDMASSSKIRGINRYIIQISSFSNFLSFAIEEAMVSHLSCQSIMSYMLKNTCLSYMSLAVACREVWSSTQFSWSPPYFPIDVQVYRWARRTPL
jgi:hypothetical protein